MDRLDLSKSELGAVNQLLDDVVDELGGDGIEGFVLDAAIVAHDLPLRVRETLQSFRLECMSGTLLIAGYEVSEERLGETPRHWRDRPSPSPALREECLLLLYASLLGDPFSWVTQQDGHLIHNVVPIQGDEYEQLGSSSKELLTWHTEDAFHPMRSDYLLFGCLRNPCSAATTIGSIDELDLSDDVSELLFQERFHILPDESHRPHNNSSDSGKDFSSIESMRSDPDCIAVLFGDPVRPYLRADPYFMVVAEGDDEAARALDELVKKMDDQMTDMDLASGNYFLIDNFRTVHGRKPFEARHDGTDRWLKRVNVTRDLRKSRSVRSGAFSRAVQ